LISLPKYRFKTLSYALAISMFAYIYYLAGHKINKVLYFRREGQVFQIHAKVKPDNKFEDLEYFGIISIIILLGLKIIYLFQFDVYCEILPVFHLLLTFTAYTGLKHNGEAFKKSGERSDVKTVKKERY
jgi:hypothetical protein